MTRFLRTTLALVAIISIASPGLRALDSISIDATGPTAYELGTKPGQFTISRTGTTGALTVLLTVTGSAISGTDYAAMPASVVIPDGASSVLVPVTPIDDATPEGGETVILSITPNSATYDLGNPFSAQVVIGDDEISASVEMGTIVSYEPFITPAGTRPNFLGAAAFRVAFSSGAVSRTIIINLGGTATPAIDYDFYFMFGHNVGFSVGSLKDIGRRSLDGAVSGGTTVISSGPPAVNGYVLGTTHIKATAGSSIAPSGSGVFENNDIIYINGEPYRISGVSSAGGIFDFDITPGLKQNTINGNSIDTAPFVDLTGINRLQVNVPSGSTQVEFMMVPKTDALAEGAETITLGIQGSTDYAIRDPVIGTAYIADTNVVASIDLTNNAVEGATPGTATVRFQGAFSRSVTVPYLVSGTATPGVDYNIVGLNNTTGIGTVTLPAGATSAPISIIAISDAVAEGIETVTVTLADSLDYQLVGSSGSTLNPSATVNIGDPNSGVVIVPVTTGIGTGGGTTAGVRPLPSSGSGNGCGLGSGGALAVVMGLLGLRLYRSRR
ncbi:MAG: hypothetical protein H0V44_03210 [Planctomycetes bacterium]|nr:hypothetical protein [Planctomycetota bacterium]